LLPLSLSRTAAPGLVPSCAEVASWACCRESWESLQAIEAIKLILETGEPLVGRLLLFDALAMRFRELKLKKNPACPSAASIGTTPS